MIESMMESTLIQGRGVRIRLVNRNTNKAPRSSPKFEPATIICDQAALPLKHQPHSTTFRRLDLIPLISLTEISLSHHSSNIIFQESMCIQCKAIPRNEPCISAGAEQYLNAQGKRFEEYHDTFN